MADLEETGYLVPIPVEIDANGYVVASESSLGAFDLSLRDIPEDPMTYRGLVIAKPAREEPLTEEPAVYAHVRFIDDRPQLPTTDQTLGLHSQQDLMKKASGKKGASTWKSTQFYHRTARKAWEDLGKVEEAKINFEDFKRALDLLDVTVLEPRAMRLFEAADLDASGEIGITEFEVALMMHDAAPDGALTPPDAFKMFDVAGTGTISRTAFPRVVDALGVQSRSLPPGGEGREKAVNLLFDKIDRDHSGEISYGEFRDAYTRLVDVNSELKKRFQRVRKAPILLRWLPPANHAAAALNRRALSKLCDAEEQAEKDAFQATLERIDQVRVSARLQRDAKQRARQAAKDKIGLGSSVDTKLRNKAKNARLVGEQAERNRQRSQEKVLKNKLAIERASLKRRETAALKLRSSTKEKDRVMQVRLARLDKLDRTMEDLRSLPDQLCKGHAAHEALSDLVWVDLGDNRLEELPESGFMMWLVAARYLRLSSNRLNKLPELELGKMERLEILRLDNNALVTLPKSIGELGGTLCTLDLSNNRLESLPAEMESLQKLEQLNLGHNRLERLCAGAVRLVGLRDLRLRGNRLFELPEELPDHLVSLTRLDVHDNRLHKLPDNLGQCIRLKVLDVSVNCLSAIPDSTVALCECEVFILRENEIVALGPFLAGWRKAAFIDASDNAIATVDSAVGSLRSVCEFRLKRNRFARLPAEMGLIKRLEKLDLSGGALESLPVELGALTLAHTLSFRHNALKGSVPGQVGLLRSVTDLDLSHNAIEFLPDTIGGLNELVKFDCSHNRLRRLPETICGCPRLETLRAAANRIDQMPLRIAEMSQLKILDLASNIIEIIPQDLSRLPNIQIISLGKNRIKSLPLDLANLSDTLDELHLDRNPLSDLPKRWASKLSGTAHQRAMWPSGYDDEAAMDWVRDHARFYAHALAEWEVSGPLHISGRESDALRSARDKSDRREPVGVRGGGAAAVRWRLGAAPGADDPVLLLSVEADWQCTEIPPPRGGRGGRPRCRRKTRAGCPRRAALPSSGGLAGARGRLGRRLPRRCRRSSGRGGAAVVRVA
ncbi:hypothetical protein M885DRAFT_505693 [Pelagophyceae sp. CCMP2097]|nr:hypothetical protein M885DRAFT_505693 [Pelagophyceae sp. CCMP2097]